MAAVEARDRFTNRGYLVRRLDGMQRNQVYMLPGRTVAKWWKFKGGVAVVDSSLTAATNLVRRLIGDDA